LYIKVLTGEKFVLKALNQIVIGLAVVFYCLPGFTQTNISGIVNVYAKVVTAYTTPLTDSIVKDNTAGFKKGDTVMIIQMNGADISLLNSNLDNMNATGLYEFNIIQSISGNKIKFVSNMVNPYNAAEGVQLIRVPSYRYARVNGDLTCSAWDGNTGGVIALITNDTLELNANMDASAKGFAGGSKTTGSSVCYLSPNKLNYLVSANDSAGLKGQGIVKNAFLYKRGRGAIGNAGGGGNGFGSGGGGGGGSRKGGDGGRVSGNTLYCANNDSMIGGVGGKIPPEYFAGTTSGTRDRIYLGGGGGAGRGINPGDLANGGAGGGIVLIITNTLKTNNYVIRANGESVVKGAINEAGSGGGGGGGSILLAADKLVGSLNIEAKGGKGGNTDHCSGQGGGGGGGFLWFSGQSLTFGNLNLTGGDPGSDTASTCVKSSIATNGTLGDSANRFNPILKGFLCNLIWQKQTICYNTAPQTLTGSNPRGGNGTYSYQWQKRNLKTAWVDITGETQRDLSPPPLTDTTYFRRVVKSAGNVDTSKWVIVNVIPNITFNTVAPDTAICYGQNPVIIRGQTLSGGDGTLTCLWEISPDNSSWNTASGPNNLINYANTSSITSKYYRRKVFSNICVNISNGVHITVNPLIGNNTIQMAQIICKNLRPQQLTGSAPTGGDNIYHYRWLKNNGDSLHWTATSSMDTFQNYSPPPLVNTTFYRRVTLSGLRNTCKDTSAMLKIAVTAPINQNQIQQDQTICGGTSPATFTGSAPTGGNNVFNFQWESSNNGNSWDSISAGINLQNYKYGILGVTKYFRRIVRSGYLDCCKDTSNNIKMTVQPAIENNQITNNQEICTGQTPARLIQGNGNLTGGNGTFTFVWQQRPVSVQAWTDITVSGNQVEYQPGSLTQTTYYRRKAMAGVCINYSDSLTTTVLPAITGNTLSGSSEVCNGQVPAEIKGSDVSGGKQGSYRYVWQDSIGSGTWNPITGASEHNFIPYVLSQKTYFRRIVKSGQNDCCISSGNPFVISINPLPVAILANIDTAICKGGAIQITFTITSGNAPFNIKVTDGITQDSIPDLVQGKNKISYTPKNAGIYAISSLKDNKGCVATQKEGSAKVRIVEVPKPKVDEGALVEGKRYKLSAVHDLGYGQWKAMEDDQATFQPSDTVHDAIVTVNNYGVHHLIWKESNEFCVDSASVELIFWMRYTAFSPNNDGKNDVLVIEGLNDYRKELTIFNRWGNEVYSSDNYQNNWDGTNKSGNPLPDDTYFYILKIDGNKGYKGYIVIKR
jgi:gliding motility-associated-like protein